MSKLKIDKDKLYKFAHIKNVANFDVLKCINLFNVKERMNSNIGIYSFIPTFIVYFSSLYFFHKRDFKYIIVKIKDLSFALQNLKYLKGNKKKSNLNCFNYFIKSKKIRIKNEEIQYNNIISKYNSLSKCNFTLENEKTEEINQYNNNIEINNNMNLNNDLTIIKKISNNPPSRRNFHSLSKNFSSSDRLNNKLSERELEKIKQIMAYNDKEINELKLIDAVKYDNRTFIQLYFSFLKTDHLLIKIMNSTDYNSLVIKIFLFFYNFSLSFFINALFFNEGTIHQILEDEGKFNFLYQLPQILYSSIISYFFGMILDYLALSKDNILEFKSGRVKKFNPKKEKDLVRTLKKKFLYFFILSFLFLLLFWYYLICFSVVYKNTQYHLIKDTLIGFSFGLVIPLGTKFIPVLFRYFGLKRRDYYFFLVSKILQIFL